MWDIAERSPIAASDVTRASDEVTAARGDTAFTVPLFDRFMRRIMPGPE